MTHTIEFKDYQEVSDYLDENFPTWEIYEANEDWFTAYYLDTRLDIYNSKTLEITLSE